MPLTCPPVCQLQCASRPGLARLCEAAQAPELKVRQLSGVSPPPQVTSPAWEWECRASGSEGSEQRAWPSEVSTSTARVEVTRTAGEKEENEGEHIM